MKIVRKFIFVIFFLFTIFIVKSSMANESFAATVKGVLDNRAGTSIPMTVSVTYKDNLGAVQLVRSSYYVVSPGGMLSITETITTSNYPSITWQNSCGQQGSVLSIPLVGSDYDFGSPDVHCKNINSSISLSASSCTGGNGLVSWSVNNIGTDGVNIANFKVYKSSSGNPDADVDPTEVAYLAGTTSYSTSGPSNSKLATLSNSTWSIKVKAFSIPDNNATVVSGSFVCGANVTPPTNIVANAYCDSSNTPPLTVYLSWTPSSLTSYNTYLYFHAGSDPGTSWPATEATGVISPATPPKIYNGNFPTTPSSMSIAYGTTYYWKVNSRDIATNVDYFSLTSSFTTPSDCTTTYAPATLSGQTICTSANPDSVTFNWNRATPTGSIAAGPNSEKLQYSTNSTFTGTISEVDVSGLSTLVRTAAFTDLQVYYWRINTKMTNGKWYASTTRTFPGVVSCAVTTGGVGLQLHGYTSCEGGIPSRFLYWEDPGGSTSWNIGYGAYGTPAGGSFTDITSTTSNYWVQNSSGMLPAPSSYGFAWRVSAYGSGTAPAAISLFDTTSCNLPTAPTTLSSTVLPCNGTSAEVTFSFKDMASNEQEHWLEVSTQPFTGETTSNPTNIWGVKKITSGTSGSPSEVTQTNRTITYTWKSGAVSNTSGPLDSGDANAIDTNNLNNLIPLDLTTYYWRVRSFNVGGKSVYTYKGLVADTAYPSGMEVNTPKCQERYDMAVSFVGDSWGTTRNGLFVKTQTFAVDETVTVKVRVQNISSTNTNYPATKFFFYYRAGVDTVPDCKNNSPQSTIPQDGTGARNQSYSVPAIAVGGSLDIPVTFNVGTTTGGPTARVYLMPECIFEGGNTGRDPDWDNNSKSNFSYEVGVNNFFQTTGGDVGAKGRISVGFDSSTLGSPIYQSDYLLLGQEVATNAKVKVSPGGFRITGYDSEKPLVPFKGIYNYLAGNFRSKATAEACTISSGPYTGIHYCAGPATVLDATNTAQATVAITGNAVFFVDGNLDIKSHVAAAGANSVVFIVSGDIIVHWQSSAGGYRPFNLDGVYISKGDFYDVNPNGGDPKLGNAAYRLTVNGAVYCDGQMYLSRYYSTISYNTLYPADVFNFDPKYFVILNSLLASADVGWKEVNP